MSASAAFAQTAPPSDTQAVSAAQSTAPEPQASPSARAADTASEVGDIVVTAQKRSESIQRVPISVTAITAEQIADRHIYDPSQLQFVAPSLATTSFSGALGATNYSVRGIGTLSFSNTVEPSVSTVIDDVVMGRPEFGIANFADVASVEVLNGPQGMLFGKNASAGLVNIKTTLPQLDRTEVIGHASYGAMRTPGTGSEWIGQGTVNVPVTANSALRVNGYYTYHSPLVKDLVDVPGSDFSQRQYGFKGKYRWQPDNSFDLVIAGDYTKANGFGAGATTDRVLASDSPLIPLDTALGITPGPRNAYTSSNALTDARFEVGGAQATATYTFGNGISITDIAAWRFFDAVNQFDADTHQINLVDLNKQVSNYDQITNEFRVSSPTGVPLEYQFGLYYYYARVASTAEIAGDLGGPPVPTGPVLGLRRDTLLNSYSYAGFGQVTYNFTSALRLTAGGRVTHDDLDYRLISSPNGALIGLDGPVAFTRSNSVKNTNFSWRVIGQYDVARDAMIYASYSRGYKGPGFNFDARTVQPEIPSSVEGGVKLRLFERRVTLNVSAFHQRFSQFQAQGYDTTTLAFQLANAGSLKSDGFETQVQLNLVPGLQLSGNVSYANTRFGSYLNDQCYPGQASCRNGVSDSSGNPLPNSPKWTISTGANYQHALTDTLDLKLDGNLYYRGKVNFQSNGNPSTIEGGYALIDLTAGLASSDGRWGVSVFCRNCGDRRFATYISGNVIATTSYGQQFGIQSYRTIGLALDFHLGGKR